MIYRYVYAFARATYRIHYTYIYIMFERVYKKRIVQIQLVEVNPSCFSDPWTMVNGRFIILNSRGSIDKTYSIQRTNLNEVGYNFKQNMILLT